MSEIEQRKYHIHIVLGLLAFILIAKAAQIQLFDQSYHIRADNTTISQVTNYPPRGIIKDRNDKIIVHNEGVYDIYVVVDKLTAEMDTAKFCQLLHITRDDFKKRIDKNFSSGRYSKLIPFVFYDKASYRDIAPLIESLHEFPAFSLTVRSKRVYKEPTAAHVLGYLNEVNPKNLADSVDLYEVGDYIGVGGIEAKYESVLRGKKGVSYILKDNRGRKNSSWLDGSRDISAVSGSDIVTTLDIDLQRYAEELMQGKSGAVVAIEPNTGEILTSVSAPSYDPNLLSIGKNRGRAFQRLSVDSTKPLLNRAIMSKYPPGSLIKPVWALLAMDAGIMSSDTSIYCPGHYTFHKKTWKCHAGGGRRNIVTAIQQSCNTYFYIAYRRILEVAGFKNPGIGLARANETLKTFGIGQKLGVDIAGENKGFLPTPEFYKKLYKDEGGRWYSTYTISNGIGQGEFELTTLQMANLASILANKGHYFKPHFIKQIRSDKVEFINTEKSEIPIPKEYYDVVIEGMHRAVTRGTAVQAYIPGIDICGKTGTSENVHGEDHSVFLAFAPKENPKIALAVYVENAGFGSTVAAPIASLLIEKYMTDSISSNRLWIEDRMKKTVIKN